MITLINPCLAVQKNDIFTTGIIYMPVGLAYLAAKLRALNEQLTVIDSFAEGVTSVRSENNQYIQGLNYDEIRRRIPKDSELIIIYANNLISHNTIMNTVKRIKDENSGSMVALMENSQAVSAYSLETIKDGFLNNGIDFLITGDSEDAVPVLLDGMRKKNTGGSRIFRGFIDNLDELPFPAWDLFPLEKYWGLGYAHGPLETKRYLPMLTSRGCPYKCNFCVSPKTTGGKWRGRSAENVVSEMKQFSGKFKLREFHIEDLNPTVSEDRIIEISRRVIDDKLDIIWKLVSGTKAETIKNTDTVRLMGESGCNYVSISPESGSETLMNSMNKAFDKEHAVKLIKSMNTAGVYTQACFVLGFPGETKQDLLQTKELLFKLIKAGVDEIALFLITPVPGSSIYNDFKGFSSLSELTFSPAWRKDFQFLNNYRLKLYLLFILTKILFHPFKSFMQVIRIFAGTYRTKMEMTPARAFKFKLASLRAGV
ncbi:MAG: radical SAM protein [Elusimicrobiota bacterium]